MRLIGKRRFALDFLMFANEGAEGFNRNQKISN